MRLELRKLDVLGSALYVAAHPDDENTAMLSWLSKGRLYRTGYLSLTRGDGGQNLIGEEKGALLGVLRTEELLAARRIDGAEQMFTRALDFGYTKSPEETLRFWNHDDVLADVVYQIRRFRPDVVVTRFPVTGEGGHGQHTASALLAEEAFAAAGNPAKFPEQVASLGTWQPRRIFWNRFSWTPIDPADPKVAKSIRVDVGAYQPLLGRSFTELAAESRSQHKSQGFGSAERRGTTIHYYDQRGGDPATKDLFEGIDTSWNRLPGGAELSAILRRAADEFRDDAPSATVPTLLSALDVLDRLAKQEEWKSNPWPAVKRAELLTAIRDCAGLSIETSAPESSVVRGADLPVTVTVVNRSALPFVLADVSSRWSSPTVPNAKLAENVPVEAKVVMKVAPNAEATQPYWLRKPPSAGEFVLDDRNALARPANAPAMALGVTIADDAGHRLTFSVPVNFRVTDRVRGEIVRSVDVVPEVVANPVTPVAWFPDRNPREVAVRLVDFAGKLDVTVRAVPPAGWKVDPPERPASFETKGDEVELRFEVTPPEASGTGVLRFEVLLPAGRSVSASLTDIDYPHVAPKRVLGDAAAKLVRVDLATRGRRIGYVMGSGDEVPVVRRQGGSVVELRAAAALDRGDFSRFDTIVTGIRAYNTRKRLRTAQPKLVAFAERGGTVVVQYNTSDELVVDPPGPFPMKLGRDRVTVEEAKIRFLDPKDPLQAVPNRIATADLDGWVQERGLYFTASHDPRYREVLAMNDPGEPEKTGAELFAEVGEGGFVYTSLSWWRQLAAGVPGALRMFVNRLSAK